MFVFVFVFFFALSMKCDSFAPSAWCTFQCLRQHPHLNSTVSDFLTSRCFLHKQVLSPEAAPSLSTVSETIFPPPSCPF